MESVLILGAGGQLGSELIKLFPDAVYTHNRMGSENYLSLRDFTSLSRKIREVSPDAVINAAAYTNVDGCERDRETAYMVNGDAVRIIAEEARKAGAYLVQVSTDYVFDGESGNYTEDSFPSPVNYYGLSKLVGDVNARAYDNSLIVRTSGVYGHKNNFPRFVYESLIKKQEIRVMEGYYSPIHASLLAKSIKMLLQKKRKGVLNVSGDRLSRMELALAIAQEFSLGPSTIKGVTNIEGMVARRPYDSSLDITAAKRILEFDFHSLRNNLSAFRSALEQ